MLLNQNDTGFQKCSEVDIPEEFYNRMQTGRPEIDQMFGTEHLPGFMAGSAITITGTPGSGKSTLLLQVAQMLSEQGKRVAVASGEESHLQIAYACRRLSVSDVDIAHIKDVETIADAMGSYDLMVVDSFQALRSNKPNLKKREFYQYAQDLLLSRAKETGCVLVFVLHITVNGLPKGGTDIIHAVDVNVKITLDKSDDNMRIIHVYKNRFGATKQHAAFMGSCGFDFQGVWTGSDDGNTDDSGSSSKRGRPSVQSSRKDLILEYAEKDEITVNEVCDLLNVSSQTASIMLRDLVGQNRMEKIGRGVDAIWKVVKLLS
jgi:predicted ATP-dependent serine protease